MTNTALLERSLNEIIRRHEALRTRFSVVNGEPVQVVAPSLILAVPLKDLRSLPYAEREREVLRLAGFDGEPAMLRSLDQLADVCNGDPCLIIADAKLAAVAAVMLARAVRRAPCLSGADVPRFVHQGAVLPASMLVALE